MANKCILCGSESMTCKHIICNGIYVYIRLQRERQREREREKKRERGREIHMSDEIQMHVYICMYALGTGYALAACSVTC